MKKLSLLLVLLTFSCQPITQDFEVIDNEKIILPPKTHHQFESRDLELQKFNKKKVEVALFLPLSGKHKELGISLANSALISLFKNDSEHNIRLVLIDSKGNPKKAKKSFQEVIKRNIKIVVGPVFSSSIKEIENDVLENNITLISFSNNKKLMGKTNDEAGIFLAGMMPETQVDRIVGHAIKNGKENFAIISPNNQYGNTVTKLFKKIVKDRDGNFITSEFYRANNRDISRAVDRTINSFTISAELRQKIKEDKDIVVNEEDRSYPEVIMIPESGKILSKIVYFINGQNINERDFQLIGTSQWSDSSTLKDENLRGALFAAPETQEFRNFERAYYRLHEKLPPKISSIAHDAIAAIAQVTDRKNGKTPYFQDFINYSGSTENGFKGIDGLFRFLPNGLLQRNLAILEVEENYFKTIEVPAEKFLNY